MSPGANGENRRRILVVDDDAALLRALTVTLRANGWDVVTAGTAERAVEAAAALRPEAVVLDLGLPDRDGLDVVRDLRTWTTVPILVLTARHSRQHTVAALDAGADDYVTKPFSVDELLARLRAATRRAAPGPGEAVVEAGALQIDLARKRVHRDGVEVRLTPTEWGVLEVLVRRRGFVVDGLEILREVWGPAYQEERHYLRVYTAQLRRKLEPDPGSPRHILTRPGRGYVFEV